MDLPKLHWLCRRCTACGLCTTRINAVPGKGNPHADLMIVGQNPGSDEDKQGKPFVGKAGKQLNKALEEVGLQRKDIYITNLVHCKTPNNREPDKHEIDTCSRWLWEEIKLINPYLIVTLGRIASQYLLQIDQPMGEMRGNIYHIAIDGNESLVIPCYHPAAISYDRSKEEIFKQDWQLIKELLI